MRKTGGQVVWIKNTFTQESLASWSVMHAMCTKERLEKRIAAMIEGSKGHQLWADLDVQEDDLILQKTRFSAFHPGLERARDGAAPARCIDTSGGDRYGDQHLLRIDGARDAMMRNFKTIMVTDANAGRQ